MVHSLLSFNHRNFPRRPPRLSISPPITRQAGAPWILKPSLHLPLIAYLSQPIALPRRQSKIYLHSNKMQKYGQPYCHPKAHAKAGTNLLRSSRCKVRVHDDVMVDCRVVAAALGVEFLHWVGGVGHEGELLTRHGGVVGIELCDDERRNDHDQTERDDGAKVEHRSQHPSPMLVNLEALNIIVREADAGCCKDHERADSRLSLKCPTEGSTADQEGTDVANQDEEDNNVAVNAVEDKQFMSDDGDELPDHEEAGW